MRELAATSGILSVIRSSAPASPFGADTPNGMDAEDVLGHLLGNSVGAAFGSNGLGPAGTGRGGGGNPGGIGMGRLRTIGDDVGGGAGGTCYGCRQSRLLRGRPSASGPSVSMGTASTSGALAPDVIRRHIRQHRNAIRHCYQRELVGRPDLAGRVAVRFVIGQDGTVVNSGVASSTIESATVGQCVARAISRVNFPPPGQGVVIVTYPFTFIHD
jgi:TonB family protein